MATSNKPGRGHGESVVVYHGTRDAETGDPIEPEEQAAEIVQPVPMVITVGNGPMREDVPLSSLPKEIQESAARQQAHIVHAMTAGELAAVSLNRCQNCRHFDNAGWGKIVRQVEAKADKMQLYELNQIRGMIAANMSVELRERHDLDKSGDIDLEHALKSLGICTAHSEVLRDTIIVHPLSSCPEKYPSGVSAENLFQPRKDFTEKREAYHGYDWILKHAQKGPKADD